MSSEIKVNKITTSSGSTLEFGGAGDTVSVGSGATVTGFGGGKVLQYAISAYTTQTSTTSVISPDGSVPQNSEGTEILTATITPTSASSKLLIEFDAPFTGGNTGMGNVFALFQDSTANAIVAASSTIMASTVANQAMLRHYMTSGTTSATTFKIRWGVTGGTGYINRWDTSAVFGSTGEATLKVMELEA
jgi:hypothetical protein